MLKKDSEEVSRGVGDRPHFNKQLIRQIVKSVERGATRRELIDRYGMGKSTLSGWVQEYGSSGYLASQKPLSVMDRRSMGRAIEEGRMTVDQAKLAFKVRSH